MTTKIRYFLRGAVPQVETAIWTPKASLENLQLPDDMFETFNGEQFYLSAVQNLPTQNANAGAPAYYGREVNPDVTYISAPLLPSDPAPAQWLAAKAAFEAAIEAAKAVVKEVTARQFKQALILQGKDDLVAATLDALPAGSPQEIATKKITRNWYDNSNAFQRDNAVLLQFAPLVGFTTPADIDAFFTFASGL